MPTSSPIEKVEFGPYELNLSSGELYRSGRKQRLPGQSFQILLLLVSRPKELVTREELRQILWASDTFVDFDQGLNNAVNRLRLSLQDSAEKPRYIETVPRRGYRFIAELRKPTSEQPPVPELPVASFSASLEACVLPPDGPEMDGRSSSRRGFVTGLVLLCVVAVLVWLASHRAKTLNRSSISSIAVLPFESAHSSQKYLADGVTEAVTAALGQIGTLRVISPTATNKYRDGSFSVRKIARELNVDAVVKGSVSRSQDHILLKADLFEAVDDRHLWAGSFDRTPKDIHSLGSDLAREVAREIGSALPSNRNSGPDPKVDPVAYDLYLQGKYHERVFRRQDNDRAIEFFEQAVLQDPSFAQAYAALAFEYGTRANELNHSDENWNRKAFVAVEKCLELNDELADCYQTRATLIWTLPNHFPYVSGIADLKHALSLNPNSDEAEQQLANIYNHIGLFDKAKPHLEKASKINPGNTAARFRIGVNQNYQGLYEEALNSLKGAERFSPNFWGYQASYALLHLGRLDEAEALLRKMQQGELSDAVSMLVAQEAVVAALRRDQRDVEDKISKAKRLGQGFEHFHHSAYSFASAYALMNQRDLAIQWLRLAAEEGFPCYPLFATDPFLINLRDDARYKLLMSELQAEWKHNEEIF